jgi:nicotinate-nucleotide--dimethylbenzimidazole phosphoribosyltransferase
LKNMESSNPFDDILKVIFEQSLGEMQASIKFDNKLKLLGLSSKKGFGELYTWLARCQACDVPSMTDVYLCILASSYVGGPAGGIVSSFIAVAEKGEANVNRLCIQHGIGLRVLEMAPEIPHESGGSWTELDCTRAIAFGMEASAAGGSLLGLSDIAPGNTSGKLALIAFCRNDSAGWLQQMAKQHSDTNITEAITLVNNAKLSGVSPLDALRILGGREVAASLGGFLAARAKNLPVVIDGWAAMAAASVLEAIRPGAASHIRLAGCDSEMQRYVALEMGLQPLVGHIIDGGPGCAAAVSVSILKAATDLVG